MTSSASTDGPPFPERSADFPDVEEYRDVAHRVHLLEQNLCQVQDEIHAIRERYVEVVAHNWRANVLSPVEALAAYRAGRSIGDGLGITGWAAVWQRAGMPAVQRLTAMAARGAQ